MPTGSCDHSLLREPVLKTVPTGLSLMALKVPAWGTDSEQVRGLLLATLQTVCGPGRGQGGHWCSSPETGKQSGAVSVTCYPKPISV